MFFSTLFMSLSHTSVSMDNTYLWRDKYAVFSCVYNIHSWNGIISKGMRVKTNNNTKKEYAEMKNWINSRQIYNRMPDCVRGNWSKNEQYIYLRLSFLMWMSCSNLEQGRMSSTNWYKRFWLGKLVFKLSQTLIMDLCCYFRTIMLRLE